MSINDLSDNVLTWREELKTKINHLHEKSRLLGIKEKQQLTVREALAVAKLRIGRDQLVFQCREVFFYMESHPKEFDESIHKAKNDVKQLIDYLDTWAYGPVFQKAKITMQDYAENRKRMDIAMPEEPPLMSKDAVVIPIEIQDILNERGGRSEHARLRWRMAIKKTIEKNRFEHERTKIKGKIYTTSVIGDMRDTDKKILDDLRKTVHDEHENLRIRHQGVIDWVKLIEEVYTLVEKDLREKFKQFDIESQRLENILKGVAKGLLFIAISPYCLDKFSDPAVQAFHGLCDQAYENLNLDNSDNESKYRIGAFFAGLSMLNKSKQPKNMTEKMDAVKKESFIEHILKIQEYLQYKIGPHSVAGELSRIATQSDELAKMFLTSTDEFNELIAMGDEIQRKPLNSDEDRRTIKESEDIKILLDESSKLWTDGNETLQVIAVVKAMKMLALREKQHHTSDEMWYLSEGKNTQLDERSKILYGEIQNQVTGNLKAAIKDAYRVVRAQYSQPREISALINMISFDGSQSGRSAVNRQNRNRLIEKLGLELKIKLLVEYAVQNLPFWGSDSYAHQKQSQTFKPQPDDIQFGRYAASGTPRRITKLILQLIAQTDNEALKEKIKLVKEKTSMMSKSTERVEVDPKNNRLLKGRYVNKFGLPCRDTRKKISPCCVGEYTPSKEQQERQSMLTDIIDIYLHGNIDVLMKNAFFHFASEQGISLDRKTYDASEHPDSAEKWLSEDQLRERVQGIFKPFAEIGVRHNHTLKEQASVTKSLLINRPLVNEVYNLYQEERNEIKSRGVQFK